MNKENKTRSMIKRNFYKSLTRQKQTKQKTMTTKSTNIKHLLKSARSAERFKKNTWHPVTTTCSKTEMRPGLLVLAERACVWRGDELEVG
jgi:hypothetical protein